MTTFHKIIKLQSQNSLIKLTTRDVAGMKHIYIVDGFHPYAFIKRDEVHRLQQSEKHILKTVDEGFRDWWGNPMFTVYFKHPMQVGKERDIIGPEYLWQADIHYELACAVKKGLGRYIKLHANIDQEYIHANDIQPLNEQEILETTFPDYEKVFLDIEVLGDPDEFPNAREADKTVVSIVCHHNAETVVFFLGDTVFKSVKHNIYGFRGLVRNFKTEEELLNAAHDCVNAYDVVIAWNSNFDKEYLQNRSRKLELNLGWNTFQWFNLQQGVASAQSFTTSFLALKTIFDDLFMYKRHAWKFLPDAFQDYFSDDTIEDEHKPLTDKEWDRSEEHTSELQSH